MLRLRRYRVLLVFAIITVGLLYHFTNLASFESVSATSVEGLENIGQTTESSAGKTQGKAEDADDSHFKPPEVGPSLVASRLATPSYIPGEAPKGKNPPTTQKEEGSSKSYESPESTGILLPIKGDNRAATKSNSETTLPKAAPYGHSYLKKPTATDKTTVSKEGLADPSSENDIGKGRLEVIADETTPKIHWSKLPEHFPVPTDSLIQLPSGKPKAIPGIQYDFRTKKSEELVQQDKLNIIKNVFSFSWAGYRQKAWMQDELSPVSGKYRNPFCGWGATLVDSLDTLWIMGMKDEFEEAVESVKDIDFTTSIRNDIPLFETVIRYLGGLVAAYDISGSVHNTLLDKAVELADILMGAFDTPNRMPMTYYLWKPTFASQPHRAKTRVVLAELGSLSLEFTRLAQITKETKYYDAIARISNEFELWQNHTKLPGLWPLKVDASGCRKPDAGSLTFGLSSQNEPDNNKPPTLPEKAAANRAAAVDSNIMNGAPTTEEGSELVQASSDGYKPEKRNANAHASDKLPSAVDVNANAKSLDEKLVLPLQGGAIKKRGLGLETSPPSKLPDQSKKSGCEPQGLTSPPYSSTEDFTLGGQADSVYEYLPKEYMLLGGLEDKYRSMYEIAADATKQHLLYRPMIPEEKRIILQSGHLQKTANEKPDEHPMFRPEGTHLTCFIGGMFAVGAKIFGRKDELDIAKRLTDGCVWAYEATNSGIMPENYLSIACEKTESCPWNETLWHEKLDPFGDQRVQSMLKQQNQQVLSNDKTTVASKEAAETAPNAGLATSADTGNTAKDDVKMKTSQTAEEEALKADAEAVANRAKLANGNPNTANPGSSAGSEIKSLEKPFRSSGDASEKPLPKLPKEGSDVLVSKPSLGAGPLKGPQLDADKSDGESSLGAEPPKEPLKKRQLGELEKPPSGFGANSVETDLALVERPLQKSPSEKAEKPKDIAEQPAVVASNVAADVPPSESILRTSTRDTVSTGHVAHPSSSPILTHEEYVAARIKDERLPAGMTKVTGGRYLLRPEAMESVFIMYRVTGDIYWREKGWEMFKAIEKHTNATYGASAISDVTDDEPRRLDVMESFWLGETLKYFYLLYSNPSVVSLDDYVL